MHEQTSEKVATVNHILRVCLLGAFFAAGCSRTEAPRSTDADVASIRVLIQQTESANNRADTLAWVNLFASDAVYMPPGMAEITTREELIDVAATGFGGYKTRISIDPLEIVVMGDWAFARSRVTGTYRSRADDHGGTVDTKQLVLYKRTSDGWRIARLINNANG